MGAAPANETSGMNEQDMRLLAERFRDCAEIGPQWFWEFDRNFKYVYLSERGRQMYGVTNEQIIGGTRDEMVRDQIVPIDPEEWRRHEDDIKNRRPFRNFHYIRRRPDGTDMHILTSGKPFFDAEGTFCGYRGVSVDITEQVTAEAQMRAAIEAIEDGFAYFDADERFVMCNSKYLDFYPGARKNLMPGMAFEEIVRNGIIQGYVNSHAPEIERYVAERMEKFRDGNLSYDAQIADGRWLRIQDRRTPDGGTACFRVDITDLKRREATLTREREQSDSANRAKTEFLSSISHELRTPMNAILGFGQLIEQKGAQLSPEKISGFARHIVRSGQHLLDLIGDVLELSKIESGHATMTIENVAVASQIGDCVEMIEGRATEAGVTLIDRSDRALPPLATDGGRFRQIVLNLLSNAVKYNRRGGSVTIATQILDDGKLRVSVSDTGEGIPTDRQGQIFEPFNRLGREAGKIEGTGIGLYLTQRLVEWLGATIGFSSKPGAGTTFWVDFPASLPLGKNAKPMNARVSMSVARPEGQITVLYIEDNPLHRLLMEEIFANIATMTLQSADSAESGLALIAERRPDLVLMDIDLPGMSGFEALERLKARPATASIPVIALTAGAADQDVERGLAAGFGDYLTKPVEIGRLIAAIELQLGFSAASATQAGK